MSGSRPDMPLKDMLFGFHGRIRRRDWWIWTLVTGLAGVVYLVALAAIVGMGDIDRGMMLTAAVFGEPWPNLLASFVVTVPVIWIQCALGVKRGHDRKIGAAPIIVLTVLSSLTGFRPEVMGSPQTPGEWLITLLLITGGVAALGLLVTLGFLDGTPGANRYGPSPKGHGFDTPDRTARVFD